MKQFPNPADCLLKWRGEKLKVSLQLERSRPGRAVFRTNLLNAHIRRAEIVDETEKGIPPLGKSWHDLPLVEVGPGLFEGEFLLDEIGVFSGKTCFFPEGSATPEWPHGHNFKVKVESADTLGNNSIYCVFPRQFGSFREVKRRLPFIMDEMGFGIIQTLPPFPVPVSYAVMGEMGCPFAALDFFSVDTSLAEFDKSATPLDQFLELVDEVHSRGGSFFIDLPANHTGWASALQTHHPEWFRRNNDGTFASPGAWGVVWSDLVELDYSNSALSSYMAEVFLFWCRNGVDGFRCDAGYMIPERTWRYIVARVREEFPDTVFMLEGLGGDIRVTDSLLANAGLDWAYSEIFQTYDRKAFEWYLPAAAERSEKFGTLVHFAETHDNDRLAVQGETYAMLRVQLAALLSWQGAWGIANGVEWFCREKIDVHAKNSLAWGSERNMVGLVSRLNFILRTDPSFFGACRISVITRGPGNTLAVLRESAGISGGGKLLVLANLDCQSHSRIDYDRSAFCAARAFDLITEKTVDLSSSPDLRPGEVLCLADAPRPARSASVRQTDSADGNGTALFRWEYPFDLKRLAVVVGGQTVEFSAPAEFRVVISDPATGKTLRAVKSRGCRALVAMPDYSGDGTACMKLPVRFTLCAPGAAVRTQTVVCISPPASVAKAKIRLSGDEVRSSPASRTVLSNALGAAASMRAEWGRIESQYDAMLSANPDPNVPSDRINLWTRTRVWLQKEGFVREFDSKFMTGFSVDPAGRFARWEFLMPCGMGRSASFVFDVSLSSFANALKFKVSRRENSDSDDGGSVRLVFRPDLEWRSFHSSTKAFSGPEELFPRSVAGSANGFVFKPYGDSFSMSVKGGSFHLHPEWSYNVAHPEEASRGLEGAGDLFSPGWISADIKAGESVSLAGVYARAASTRISPRFPSVEFPDATAVPVARAMRKALSLYIVRRDSLKTVIAGYPWFLDWGRDTFIFMRGMLAAGMTADAIEILKAFAAFENRGTLPNIIHGTVAGNRDTTDAPLWFIRCVREISEMKDVAGRKDIEKLKACCDSIVENYISGTPNSIYMDKESALVWSPAHFTWMDTDYPACTPRAGYPVEIQALWISALEFLGRGDLAAKARESLKRYFKTDCGYCDVLSMPEPGPASHAVPDDAVRPNQLFLATLGIVSDKSILEATRQLIVPGSMRSLAAGHPLYRGVYAGDEDTCRKQAYHNGTAWGWVFPLYVEAMVACGFASKSVALDLLACSVDNINSGCLCHLSEIADGDAPHAQKGCAAQAWSDSEFFRVWSKLAADGDGK